MCVNALKTYEVWLLKEFGFASSKHFQKTNFKIRNVLWLVMGGCDMFFMGSNWVGAYRTRLFYHILEVCKGVF